MSTPKLILVIGATGAQGLAVIDALLAPDASGKPTPYSVRALTRDRAGQRALELSARGVECVKGMFCGRTMKPLFIPFIPQAHSRTKTGFKPEYKAAHMTGKGLVAEWLHGQTSSVSKDGLTWTIVETLPYTDMLACGLFEPLNVRADGTVVFAAPAGHAKFPLVTLKDIGWWARYTFDHRTETSGRDLSIASHVVSWDEIAKTFTKVTGKPAVYKAQSVEEWWNNFGEGVNRPYGSGSMTVKENFSGFWKVFGDELVPRDMEWIRSVHPGTQTLEDWMRDNNYTGSEGTILKGREDHGDWGLNEEVTKKL
ncbi:NmrA domain-containing protein [Mycena venus]|uniref:NmrA domain-containing protein n=1 Tax=Mycena venus TaxID=2733690 RepID=A0A8H6X3H1_9AGAR|nr:NmrA domain-containing protein [Mycena venus]